MPLLFTDSINPADWPQDWSKPPDTNSDLVKEWLKELDGKNIPAFKPNPTVDCQDPQNAEALSQAGTGGRCWWFVSTLPGLYPTHEP